MAIKVGNHMHETMENICTSLNNLSDAVKKQSHEGRLLVQAYGWHHPSLTRHDLAELPAQLSRQLKEANINDLDKELINTLSEIPNKLQLLENTTLPYMFNGNGYQAIPAYMATINWVSQIINPLIGFTIAKSATAIPTRLAKKIRSLKTQVDDISVNKKELEEQIETIKNATEAAESLPADLEDLKAAQKKIDDLLIKSIKESSKISELENESRVGETHIRECTNKSDKLVDQCEEAYRITTTKGLAGAFEQRASKLALSMWIWVIGLLFALVIGSYIGAIRLESLTKALTIPEPVLSSIIIQLFLSILSLGAPLWFAWLSTKQIGQHFKLSEDYAFKASVAKAYEGYRKEAARLDEAFEARLFSTALNRVEEAPLRLIDKESHGSPWQELISSEVFQTAMDNIPELKEKFINVAKGSLKKVIIKKEKTDSDKKP
jgi:chaperonin cofactor prefoldin